jgi:large subunit ribosomal protein L6
MSRIGRLPIAKPDNVKVHVSDGTVRVEGPHGTLTRQIVPEVTVSIEGGTIVLSRSGDTRHARSVHGLTRRLIANMVEGVSKKFTRVLEINGVGYRAEARGQVVFLTLGYSHPIAYHLPEGVTAKVERQVIVTLEGADREILGTVASQLRALRPPEPYKGKGVKYAGEHIRRKAGKAAAGAAR